MEKFRKHKYLIIIVVPIILMLALYVFQIRPMLIIKKCEFFRTSLETSIRTHELQSTIDYNRRRYNECMTGKDFEEDLLMDTILTLPGSSFGP